MSKHLIFFIHGMGKHTKGWSDDSWKAFENAYNSYEELKPYPFNDRYERVEVLYDEIFETYRQRWKDDSAQLIKLISDGGASINIINQVNDLGAALGKDSYFTTHILDVVMYRFLSLVRIPVRVTVAEQIAKKLVEVSNKKTVTWSVVTHSLGTSVGHDTLHYMFQGGESDIKTLSRDQFAPHTGLFVANVSRVFESTIEVYKSLVRPSWQRKNGIFEFYLNAHHILDPFTIPKHFNPDFNWLDQETRDKKFARYWDLKPSEITKPNVHDLGHYLANPIVHIPFIRALFGRDNIISGTTEQKFVEAYRQEALKKTYNALANQLTNLIDKEGPGIEGLLEAASKFNYIVSNEGIQS